jgi:hypothetical protein
MPESGCFSKTARSFFPIFLGILDPPQSKISKSGTNRHQCFFKQNKPLWAKRLIID